MAQWNVCVVIMIEEIQKKQMPPSLNSAKSSKQMPREYVRVTNPILIYLNK
jgi:hypothetical protein